jgi:glutamate/tyrosine decarboxylase-like PLP-dependent enzyme
LQEKLYLKLKRLCLWIIWGYNLSREDNFIARTERFFRVPNKGISFAAVDRQYDISKTRFPVVYGDEQWAKPGTLPDLVAMEFAFDMVKKRNPNLVEPTMFLGAWEIEREAISMLADLMKHPDHNYQKDTSSIFGWFTDGGTSSLLQASWTLRNNFYRRLANGINGADALIRETGYYGLVLEGLVDPNKPPVVLAPVDMHFSGDKVSDVLGIGKKNLLRYGLKADFSTDYDDLENLVQEVISDGKDIMYIYVGAGTTETGRVEDVREIHNLLNKISYEAPIIVDAAQQYMMLSLLDHFPEWDFRVDSVQAIVADPHKTEASPYPASVVIFRDKNVAIDTKNSAGYLHLNDELEYDMKSTSQLMPQLPTSRSPIGAISTWAYLLLSGMERLLDKQEKIFNITHKIANFVKSSPYFKLIANPQTGIVPFHVTEYDDEKARYIYSLFANWNEDPRFYISYSDSMRVKTRADFLKYTQSKNKTLGEKIDGFGGLYIQVMPHATDELSDKLIERLDQFGYYMTKKTNFREYPVRSS